MSSLPRAGDLQCADPRCAVGTMDPDRGDPALPILVAISVPGRPRRSSSHSPSNRIPLMVSEPILPSVTFKSMGRDKRREVLQLAVAGKRHSDPAISAAAYRWSHAKRWNSLANRLPGWLLPGLGVIYILLAVVLGLPWWLGTGGMVVVVIGLLGWINTSGARSLRAVYRDEGLNPALIERDPSA